MATKKFTGENGKYLVQKVVSLVNDKASKTDLQSVKQIADDNKAAIEKLNGAATVAGSVAKSVADGIASVVAGAPADFDTLKEIADYIASDKTGAADLSNKISATKQIADDNKAAIEKLNGAATVAGSVAKTVADAITDAVANVNTEIAKKVNITDLHAVATSGDYNDLDNVPTFEAFTNAEIDAWFV